MSMLAPSRAVDWPSSDRPPFRRSGTQPGAVVLLSHESGEPSRGAPVLRKEDVRSPAQQYRRDVSRRNWAFDIALAAVVGVLGQLEVWLGIGSTHRQVRCGCSPVVRRDRPPPRGSTGSPLACLAAIVVVSIVEFAAVGSPEGIGVSCAADRHLHGRQSAGVATLRGRAPPGCRGLGGLGSVRPDEHDLRRGLSSLVWLTPSIIAWLLGALVRSPGSMPSSGASTASSGRPRRWPRNEPDRPRARTT